MDDGSLPETEWITEMRIRWAAHRAAGRGRLRRRRRRLAGRRRGPRHGLRRHHHPRRDRRHRPRRPGRPGPALRRAGPPRPRPPAPTPPPPAPTTPAAPPAAPPAPSPAAGARAAWASSPSCPGRRSSRPSSARRPTCCPGPGGLASFLRTRQLGARLAGPSLPLDIGFSATIPAGIRNAVILRDRKCRWPGGCTPARRRLPGPPRHAPGPRRRDQPQRLRAALQLPPPDRHPPLGLDPGS